MSLPPVIDLDDLGLDEGGHLLLKRSLEEIPPAGRLGVRGRSPALRFHLPAWCRQQGHGIEWPEVKSEPPGGENGGENGVVAWIVAGTVAGARGRRGERAGAADPLAPGAVVPIASQSWGLAARGALVEAGSSGPRFPLNSKHVVWTDAAPAIYRQAAASQWDPATDVDWGVTFELPEAVERAVVQVMTYLVENENAALVVPARFLAQIHPHFREVMGVLAVQVADEARHVEVFTRRAQLTPGGELGVSSAGGQASLQTLLEEPDFTLAHFMLSVMGEGTFLSLLSFIETHAPDPITRQVVRLALADEARHVAFGMAHLDAVLAGDPGLRSSLAAAVRRRHDVLSHTAGLNEEVFEALVVLAAGEWSPPALRGGFAAVQELEADMAEGRRRRLVKLGFPPETAAELAALHTRNFM